MNFKAATPTYLESLQWFAKLKPIVTIDNPLADLFIRQTFSSQMLTKKEIRQSFSLPNFPAMQSFYM